MPSLHFLPQAQNLMPFTSQGRLLGSRFYAPPSDRPCRSFRSSSIPFTSYTRFPFSDLPTVTTAPESNRIPRSQPTKSANVRPTHSLNSQEKAAPISPPNPRSYSQAIGGTTYTSFPVPPSAPRFLCRKPFAGACSITVWQLAGPVSVSDHHPKPPPSYAPSVSGEYF